MNRKIALAVGAGVIAAGGVLASAATLGTLNVGTLGTNSGTVAACSTTNGDIKIKWNVNPPVYVGSAPTFNTLDADVNVPTACIGKTLVLTVAKADGTALATSAPTTLATASTTITLNAPTGVNSKDVGQTTVTIYD